MNAKELIGDAPIYYINLNRAEGRKNKLEKLFQINDITNFKRIEAIDGNDLDLNYYEQNYILPKRKLNIYEIACTFSHLKAIKTAFDDNVEYALIIEDDCNFDYIKYKTLPLQKLINYAPDWECIQLSMINSKKNFEIVSNSSNILVKLDDAGATAYLINRRGMEKVLSRMNNKELFVSEIFIFNYLNTYVTKPYFSYYFRNEEISYIRENTKSAFATQTFSKMWWDNFYKNM
jgi:GR25 family glycosyltransferase involved in LPS biosynthesis